MIRAIISRKSLIYQEIVLKKFCLILLKIEFFFKIDKKILFKILLKNNLKIKNNLITYYFWKIDKFVERGMHLDELVEKTTNLKFKVIIISKILALFYLILYFKFLYSD